MTHNRPQHPRYTTGPRWVYAPDKGEWVDSWDAQWEAWQRSLEPMLSQPAPPAARVRRWRWFAFMRPFNRIVAGMAA